MRQTKADLESRIAVLERQLEERVSKLEALSKACNSRFIRYRDKKFIALPLTREEDEAVRETIENSCLCLFGEGDLISGSYDEGEATYAIPLDHTGSSRCGDRLLPQWDGYYVIHHYSREDGTYGHRIWGMKEVK